MSDKESAIMVHNSDSESDSENLTEQVSGRDSKPMEGLNNIIEGPVPNLSLLGTECTENQKDSEQLVLLEGDKHALPSGSKVRPKGFNLAIGRLPSQSMQRQVLDRAGRLSELETNLQKQIPPRAECIDNQNNCTVPVTKKQIIHKAIIQKDQSELLIMVDSSDDEKAQVLAPLSPSLQFQGLEEIRMLLEEQNAQSHNRTQAGSVMLEGEQETSGSGQEQAENGIHGSVSHPPSIKINVIQGPVSNLQMLDTQLPDNQNQSEEFVSLHVESDQHASGSNLRQEGPNLSPSVHSLERQSHEDNTPLKTDCTKNQKDSVILEGEHAHGIDVSQTFALLVQSDQDVAMGLVIPSENCVLLSCTQAPHLENQTEFEYQVTGRNPELAAGQNNVTQGLVLNPPGIPTFDTVSQGRSDLECTESPTDGRDAESVNWSTLNTTRADFETRQLSQSLQAQGLNRAGSLLEEMNKQSQIQAQGECLENQTNCIVSEAEQFESDTSIEHTQSNYTGGSIPDVKFPGIEDRLLTQSLQIKGLEGAGRLLEKMYHQKQIPEPAEDLNITQYLVSNKTGIQECDMDCTVNKEVFGTSEGDQHESGIDIRPAEGINDRDTPQSGRKRGLSPDLSQGATSSNLQGIQGVPPAQRVCLQDVCDTRRAPGPHARCHGARPSPSKRKSKTGGEFRMQCDESYFEQCLYAIILPFRCPSNQRVVKVGVSRTPKKRFDHIKWGLKAIIQDEFAELAELKLKDGICLSRTTPADKIIDEIFTSRIWMREVELKIAESDVRDLIMAAKVNFFMSLKEAIHDTSDTDEEAVQKINRINTNCGPTEWIMCDTRTVEALRNAYKNGELDGNLKTTRDDKRIWGSYQEFTKELQKVIRNYQ